MKSKRYEQLAIALADIYTKHADEIASIPREGAKGGANARSIEGWTPSPSTSVSKIVRREGWAHMNYWSGSNPTPSTAIPACIYDEVLVAYNRLYKEA
jgi:hypothetical protein